MRFYKFLFVALLLAQSCWSTIQDRQSDSLTSKENLVPEGIAIDANQVGQVLTDSIPLDEHFFGSFYQEQLDFYVIEQPDLFIGDVYVRQMELGYLSGQLLSKKYVLDADIATHLIKTYGRFSIKPLRSDVGDFIKGGCKVLIDNERLNEQITHYQLKWKVGDETLLYRVDPSLEDSFILIRQSKDYNYLLAAVN